MKYDALAWHARKERRRVEYARLAELYRFFAEEAVALNAATNHTSAPENVQTTQ